MLIIISAPLCLLSFILAFLCYRKAHYKHTLVLALIAMLLLVFTVSLIGASYLLGIKIEEERVRDERASEITQESGTETASAAKPREYGRV